MTRDELLNARPLSGPRLIDGDVVAALIDAVTGGGFEISSATYEGSSSYQPVASDLNLGSDASGSFLAGVMGNALGDDINDGGSMIAGTIGAYSITTANDNTMPAGGVLGIVMDGSVGADGAVVAVLDGDSGVLTANAAFKAMMNNSNAGSGFDYGLDLTSGAHDGFLALAILKADIRCSNNVCILNGAGVPVDGTTGDNFAGPGSIYIDITNSEAYLQTSLISTPVWKKITRAA